MATENQIETFEGVLKALKDTGYEVKSIEFDIETDKVTIFMVNPEGVETRALVSDHQ